MQPILFIRREWRLLSFCLAGLALQVARDAAPVRDAFQQAGVAVPQLVPEACVVDPQLDHAQEVAAGVTHPAAVRVRAKKKTPRHWPLENNFAQTKVSGTCADG